MQTQLPEGKRTGTAGRSHAAVPRMSSRTGSAAASVTAMPWRKTAGKTGSAARTAIAFTLAGATL